MNNDNSNQLDQVLKRVSASLSELRDTCVDLQNIARSDDLLDGDRIMKAQALDRVTQSLDCLSAFSAALARIPFSQSTAVTDEVFNVIQLESVRRTIDATAQYDDREEGEDIELFAE